MGSLSGDKYKIDIILKRMYNKRESILEVKRMNTWRICIDVISYVLEITRAESTCLLILVLMGGIIKCFYPWERKWKTEKTKDKDGNEVTIYSQLRK